MTRARRAGRGGRAGSQAGLAARTEVVSADRRARGQAADAGERGAAAVEFVAVFLALVVPLVYAIAIMADVQRALLAVSTAAREVGRVYVTASDAAEAAGRADVAYEDIMGNSAMTRGIPGLTLRYGWAARPVPRPAASGSSARGWR
jgi:hypothetical protein